MEKQNSLGARSQRSVNRAAAVFLLPVTILLIVYIFYPIVDSFRISGYKWSGISVDRTFVGLRNWAKLVKDMNFWLAFRNNVIIMVLSIIIQIPIGLAEATFIEFAGKEIDDLQGALVHSDADVIRSNWLSVHICAGSQWWYRQ